MTHDDRRRFFRISDHIRLAYQVVEETDINGLSQTAAVSDPSLLLPSVNKTVYRLLGQLKLQQPVMAELLEALDQKINIAIEGMQLDSLKVDAMVHEFRLVNISACGAAFYVPEELQAGQILQIDLLLSPEDLQLRIFADIVDVSIVENTEQETEQAYYLRVAFRDLEPGDQELLIQHIVRSQGEQLRRESGLD